jgi:SAM-dependent methyltransferase
MGYLTERGVTEDTYKNWRLPAYIREQLPGLHARILDFGCGMGQMLRELKRLGYTNIIGADIHSRDATLALAEGIEVQQIDKHFYQRGPEGAPFDFIIMSHVIEHMTVDEAKYVLTQLHLHFLSKKGAVLILTPNMQSPTTSYWRYEDFTHAHGYTTGSLQSVLQEAGSIHIQFLDLDALSAQLWHQKLMRRPLLAVYKWMKRRENKVVGASYHASSPVTYAWELKALARSE